MVDTLPLFGHSAERGVGCQIYSWYVMEDGNHQKKPPPAAPPRLTGNWGHPAQPWTQPTWKNNGKARAAPPRLTTNRGTLREFPWVRSAFSGGVFLGGWVVSVISAETHIGAQFAEAGHASGGVIAFDVRRSDFSVKLFSFGSLASDSSAASVGDWPVMTILNPISVGCAANAA